jgi:ribosomal protein S18 acetylase RimI-like enzyme
VIHVIGVAPGAHGTTRHWQGVGVYDAERGLHRRTGLACQAAVTAGVGGRFRVWEQAGLLAVLATDPTLAFLSTVSGVTPETVPALIDLVGDPVWGDVRPTVVAADMDQVLSAAGFVRTGDRGLAVRDLTRPPPPAADVVETGPDAFVPVLLAGYGVDPTVAAFIEAEHRLPAVQRFLVLANGMPIAAAAMTVHDRIAVLGGASTLSDHRRTGAQSRLVRHRLHRAADAGCTTAVATVVPDSTSAHNLRAAGFTVHRRGAWTRQPTGTSSTATDRSARLPR